MALPTEAVGHMSAAGASDPLAGIELASALGTLAPILCGAVIAAGLALCVARALGLDSMLWPRLARPRPEPLAVIRQLRTLAELGGLRGRSALTEGLATEGDPFLADAVRMAAGDARPEQIRSELEHRLDRDLAAQARVGQRVARLARVAPVVGAVGLIVGAVAMGVLRTDTLAASPFVAGVLLSLLLLALVSTGLQLPTSDRLAARAAEQAMIRTIIIAGVMGLRRGEPAEAMERRLLGLLPPLSQAGARLAAA